MRRFAGVTEEAVEEATSMLLGLVVQGMHRRANGALGTRATQWLWNVDNYGGNFDHGGSHG